MSEMNGDNKVGVIAILAVLTFAVTLLLCGFNAAHDNNVKDQRKIDRITELCHDEENVPECITLTLEALDG